MEPTYQQIFCKGIIFCKGTFSIISRQLAFIREGLKEEHMIYASKSNRKSKSKDWRNFLLHISWALVITTWRAEISDKYTAVATEETALFYLKSLCIVWFQISSFLGCSGLLCLLLSDIEFNVACISWDSDFNIGICSHLWFSSLSIIIIIHDDWKIDQ